ncbi:hypothetical protein DMP23_04990 [Amycolatopsis sp. A1MSW2902]|uniref:FDXHR family putative zinc-binding protein n=1 Tax=Amycolatopsis sp. A1MSW2902 TaxID=687413 RepID=UPI0030B7986D
MTNTLTCGGCPNTWTGVSRAHCSACHRTFGGVVGFDKHRHEGRCRDPLSQGLTLKSGIWVHPAPPMASTASPLTGNEVSA